MPCRELLCYCSCNIMYACWPSVTAQNTQLFKHAFWLSGAARWMLAVLWHSISMSADLLSLNIACLLALCFSICYTCWYGVSLSAVSAGTVSHYQPCLLVWCLTISRVSWYGVSLSAVPAGVVLHFRSCLLVWCLTVGHVFWRGTSLYAMPAGLFCTSTNILTR